MGTVFPFTTSDVGHSTGVPLGYNKQTGTPILFDNFHSSLTIIIWLYLLNLVLVNLLQ